MTRRAGDTSWCLVTWVGDGEVIDAIASRYCHGKRSGLDHLVMSVRAEVAGELHGGVAAVSIDGHRARLLVEELSRDERIGGIVLGQGCTGDELALGVDREVALVAVLVAPL